MHIDIDYAKFYKFVCFSREVVRKNATDKRNAAKSASAAAAPPKKEKEPDYNIDETKLRVQIANLIWVLYLEANCWKYNTKPLDCFEQVVQDGRKKSLYGWKQGEIETVPEQDNNIAVYSVYSSNPSARRV